MATALAPLQPAPDALARIPRAVAFRYDALALTISDGTLTVAVPRADDGVVLDALRTATRLRIAAVAMGRNEIRDALHTAYGHALIADAGDSPAVRAVDALLQTAIAAHASDVHVEPDGSGARVRIRVDGILRELDRVPAALVAPFVSRLKLLAGMDIADRRQPQDGRFTVPVERREVDARVSSVPARDGETLVVRLLDRHASAPRLDALGMDTDMLERYRAAVAAPWGFVVVTGPTGSGKTTTLYASLGELDSRTRSICSVEDPIEMRLDGVTQVQVNLRAGLSFPVVLRSFMRQDPDVLMVGEMRDAETAAVAVSAALAGQIVFTTLHANDAPRTVDRLVELGVSRHALASALSLIVAQRLVRVLCERCRRPEAVPARLREALPDVARWYVPGGCRLCSGTGFVGRTALYELLDIDDDVRDAIASGASSVQIAQLAARNRYRPVVAQAVRRIADGTTSFAEVLRVANWSGPR